MTAQEGDKTPPADETYTGTGGTGGTDGTSPTASGPNRPEGAWTGRVAYSDLGGGYAYRPGQIYVNGQEAFDAARTLIGNIIGAQPGAAMVNDTEWVLIGPDNLDVPELIAELRDAGVDAEPNYVLFNHAQVGCGCGCNCGCGGGLYGNPLYANPLYANPLYANPLYANPVYANPIYASPVYASPLYANPIYANQYQTAGTRASTARPAAKPDMLPVVMAPGPQRAYIFDTGIAAPAQLPELLKLANYETAPAIDHDPPDEAGDGFLDPAAGHGTFIAGIIELLAPGRDVHAEGVLSSFGDGDVAHIIARLDALIAAGQLNDNTIINMSFGGYADKEMRALARAIRRVQRTGAVVVASSGNDGSCRHTYPACLPAVVSVGSVEACGPAPYSNHGDWVRCCAPGTDVVSAFYKDYNGGMPVPPIPGSGDPDHFEAWARWTGTSFAAPLVTAALLRHMAITGQNAADAVAHLIDSPGLFRIPGLGTVINTITPVSG